MKKIFSILTLNLFILGAIESMNPEKMSFKAKLEAFRNNTAGGNKEIKKRDDLNNFQSGNVKGKIKNIEDKSVGGVTKIEKRDDLTNFKGGVTEKRGIYATNGITAEQSNIYDMHNATSPQQQINANENSSDKNDDLKTVLSVTKVPDNLINISGNNDNANSIEPKELKETDNQASNETGTEEEEEAGDISSLFTTSRIGYHKKRQESLDEKLNKARRTLRYLELMNDFSQKSINKSQAKKRENDAKAVLQQAIADKESAEKAVKGKSLEAKENITLVKAYEKNEKAMADLKLAQSELEIANLAFNELQTETRTLLNTNEEFRRLWCEGSDHNEALAKARAKVADLEAQMNNQ